MEETADVIIVGGGPAGLSATLVLGRCRRRVIVFDTGRQRNRSSYALNAFIGRDGISPAGFLREARRDLNRYDVTLLREEVVSAHRQRGTFIVRTAPGKSYSCRKLLLATGLADRLPEFPGAEAMFGSSLFHCPFCDGWSFRDKAWVVYARSRAAAVENCLRYKSWTNNITLLAAYVKGLTERDRQRLRRHNVQTCDEKVVALTSKGAKLKRVELESGGRLPADVIFFSGGSSQSCALPDKLGCRKSPKGIIEINHLQESSIPGLYIAGDMAKEMQLAVIAAGDGARAAVAIHVALNKEEYRRG